MNDWMSAFLKPHCSNNTSFVPVKITLTLFPSPATPFPLSTTSRHMHSHTHTCTHTCTQKVTCGKGNIHQKTQLNISLQCNSINLKCISFIYSKSQDQHNCRNSWDSVRSLLKISEALSHSPQEINTIHMHSPRHKSILLMPCGLVSYCCCNTLP